jgi:hypothetical protein
VLYVGVDNPVTVAASGIASSSITVMINNGSITGSNGKYIIHPSLAGKCMVYVFQKNGNAGKVLDSVLFRVKSIPAPVISLGGKRDGDSVSVQELSAAAGVVAVFNDFDFDFSIRIASFDLTFLKAGSLFTFRSNGPAFTPQMRSAMQALSTGSRLFIENVVCTYPDGTLVKIAGMVLRVK